MSKTIYAIHTTRISSEETIHYTEHIMFTHRAMAENILKERAQAFDGELVNTDGRTSAVYKIGNATCAAIITEITLV